MRMYTICHMYSCTHVLNIPITARQINDFFTLHTILLIKHTHIIGLHTRWVRMTFHPYMQQLVGMGRGMSILAPAPYLSATST